MCNLYFQQISIQTSHISSSQQTHVARLWYWTAQSWKLLIGRQTWLSNIPFINSGYTPWVQLIPFGGLCLFSITDTEYRSRIEVTCPKSSTEWWKSQDEHSDVLTPRAMLFPKHHTAFSHKADFKYFTTFENTLGLLFPRKTLLVVLHMCLSDQPLT